MRDGEPGLVDLLVSVEEQVAVERARAVLARSPGAAEALLGREQPVEELASRERRLELGGAVEEERLRADADRLRLAQRRDGDDFDPVLLGERLERGADRRLAVAEIRAQPDVRPSHGRVTVTPTVPSRPAGSTSGLRTRTTTRSGAKRVSSSVATAVASASRRVN